MLKINLLIKSLWISLLGICVFLESGSVLAGAQQGTALVAKDGKTAVVVIADNATPVASLAANEFVDHIEKATGARLDIVRESQAGAIANPRVFIGQTQAAMELGVTDLSSDESLIRTQNGDLFIFGIEEDMPYSDRSGYNGTLHGVYRFLDQYVGVLWLWPGDLGTYVPNADSLLIPALDDRSAPPLEFRRYRIGHLNNQIRSNAPHLERLGFSREGLVAYRDAVVDLMRRHQLGQHKPKPAVGHFFETWWKKYGKEHPDWFAMNKDGKRVGPTMNVANPELHRFLVNEIWDGKSNISLGEADRRIYDLSPESMAWDDPQPADWPHHITSNRYARFAKVIRDMAREKNPNADFLVTMFLYMDYTHAPTIDIDLEGVYGEFCPWFSGFNPWYPMSPESHELFKETWLGWHKTGMTMGYRPNYLLNGYVMPHFSTWQTGDMFRFAAANGMVGHDFDSLWAQWAVKGPMLYLHMRLPSNPARTVEEIRKEYFSAFGPAAGKVEQYFDYWEAYSENEASGGGVSRTEPWRSGTLYPATAFVPAEKILAQALALAKESPDPQYAERIAYLQVGLEHAKMAADFARSLRFRGKLPTDNRKQFEAAKGKLKQMIQFRRDNEHLFFADLVAAAYSENRGIDIGGLLDAEFTENDKAPSSTGVSPWINWYFREDSLGLGVEQGWYTADPVRSSKGILVYDEAGQAFEFDRDRWSAIQVPARLAETSVGDFRGIGWYATTFVGQEEWKDRDLELHFNAVDEQAWVYLNGEYIGEHTVQSEGKPVSELWDKAFVVKIPARLVHIGEENLLVIRMHSADGAAGIWGPVSLSVAPIKVESEPPVSADFSRSRDLDKVQTLGNHSVVGRDGLISLRGSGSVLFKEQTGPGRYIVRFALNEPEKFEYHQNRVRLFVPDLAEPSKGGVAITWDRKGLVNMQTYSARRENVSQPTSATFDVGETQQLVIDVSPSGSELRVFDGIPAEGQEPLAVFGLNDIHPKGHFGVLNSKWYSEVEVYSMDFIPAPN